MTSYWRMSAKIGSQANEMYKYEGKDGKCRNQTGKKIKSKAKASSIKYIKKEEMRAQIQKGPFSVAMDGSGDCWHFYESGIITSASPCGDSSYDTLDHGVAVVGLNESTD